MAAAAQSAAPFVLTVPWAWTAAAHPEAAAAVAAGGPAGAAAVAARTAPEVAVAAQTAVQIAVAAEAAVEAAAAADDQTAAESALVAAPADITERFCYPVMALMSLHGVQTSAQQVLETCQGSCSAVPAVAHLLQLQAYRQTPQQTAADQVPFVKKLLHCQTAVAASESLAAAPAAAVLGPLAIAVAVLAVLASLARAHDMQLHLAVLTRIEHCPQKQQHSVGAEMGYLFVAAEAVLCNLPVHLLPAGHMSAASHASLLS